MTSTTATADTLLEALLAEASAWACDDTEDQQVLDAIDAASAPADKLTLLQYSSLVPSRLFAAIAEALAALDPATYTPPPTASSDMAFLALATVMVRAAGTSVAEARARVEAMEGEEIDPAAPHPGGVRISALSIEPGTLRLDQIGDVPVADTTSLAAAGAPASMLPPAIRTSLADVVAYCWSSEERDFAEQDHQGRARHIFPALRQLRAYLDKAA
ncbi:hypothetical protein ABZ896_19900 [Streptomyces sp. NPDC047072]|uniref:hypothetical protein n=1 Tax=Streptomyces sp. NPDC047072 TaxID=3154809 RepID=UPI0033F2FC85